MENDNNKRFDSDETLKNEEQGDINAASAEGEAQAESVVAPERPSFGKLLLMSKKKAKAAGYDKKTLFLIDIKEWVVAIVCAVAAVLLLINFVGRVITVDGSSMSPTLTDGERLLVSAYDVRFGSAPAKGDVVICHYPGRTTGWPSNSFKLLTVKTDFVKRVVGVPGDTVRREHGVTYVNDWALDPSSYRLSSYTYKINDDGAISYYINGVQTELTDEQTIRYSFDYTYTLGENEYFVVGDNRYNSHDSRAWNGPDLPYNQTNDASGHVGPITKSMIIGHVRSVILPFKNARGVANDTEYLDAKDVK